MADAPAHAPAAFRLVYWPIPFRGQFIRWVLAQAGAAWDEVEPAEVIAARNAPVTEQPVPFMAPPMLIDRARGVALAQTGAILAWLGERFDMLPAATDRRALALKLLGDVNDVLEEMTLNGGRQMWDAALWGDFAAHRLPRWMAIFEETGRRHGLGADRGHVLGGRRPGLADLASACLWFTMTDKLPRIGRLLRREAPLIAAHSRRIADLPAIAALRARTDAAWGETWCGGQIEASLRRVLSRWEP